MTTLVDALPTGDSQGYKLIANHYQKFSAALELEKPGTCDESISCYVTYIVSTPWEVKTAPSWLDQNKSYAWTNWKRDANTKTATRNIFMSFYRGHRETREEFAWPDDLSNEKYLAKMSAKLPEWAYIYLPPTDDRNYPMFLNQGKPLLFIEPIYEPATAAR